MRYRSREGFETKTMNVYDLYDEQGYECALVDFLLQRTAATPFRYPYVIKLFVKRKLDGPTPSPPIHRVDDSDPRRRPALVCLLYTSPSPRDS